MVAAGTWSRTDRPRAGGKGRLDRLRTLVSPAPGVQDDMRLALLDVVAASPGALLGAGVLSLLVTATLAWQLSDSLLLLLASLSLPLAIWRTRMAVRYKELRALGEPLDAAAWDRRYAAAAWLFSWIPGLACMQCLSVSADARTHLLVASLTVGYAGAVAGRTAARPHVAFGQVLILLLPLAYQAAQYQELTYRVLSVLIPVFCLTMASVILGLYETTLRSLRGFEERRRDTEALARQNAALAESRDEARLANLRFQAALSNMSQGLVMFDAEQRLTICNGRYAELYGLSPDALLPGMPLQEVLRLRELAGNAPADRAKFFDQHVRRALEGRPSVYSLLLQDGRTMRISHAPMSEGGWVATHEDITEAVKAEERMSHMARHDTLTDLANRVRFHETLSDALQRAGRDDAVAVLCIDLDRFKSVNDTLGHPIGDALLKQVASRLRGFMREGDTVARLGGDEFALVQVGAAQPNEATILAQRVIDRLSQPYEVDGHQLVVGASVGIAIAPNDGRDPDQLLRSADMALYRAKTAGRGDYRFFEADMDAAMQARRTLEIDLRLALARGEFHLHYQPLVDIGTHRITGFEALLRWEHPTRGPVSPAEFIPLAEEIGLIVPLGDWVLRQACADAARWAAPLRVAVNLSPVQFRGRHLVASVYAALTASGLAAPRLELEITETVMLEDTESTLETLMELRELGVRISMDDFGTGYSSLSYLRRFPFDKIKIDQSFVRDLPARGDSVAIVRAVSGLGISLGMTTTAEGVETREQLDALEREGCMEVQGYLFGRPMPASAVLALLGAEEAATEERAASASQPIAKVG